MSNELSTTGISDNELIAALRASVYTDASDESIKMVMSYCKALHLDPMTKPVHITKMGDKEVIMPGIGLYRIRAHRSGTYLGMTEPEFGPEVTGLVGKTQMTYPQWCKVTVKRLVAGNQIAEFTAKEIWKECYGTIADKVSPNIFWYKRPYSQLAKTAESQALRKAFPDIVSSAPTIEEMHLEEHKDEVVVENAQVAVDKTADEIKNKFITLTADESGDKIDTETGEVIENPALKAELVEELRLLLQSKGIPAETYNQWKEQASVKSFTELTVAALRVLIDNINKGVL
jgi:phage recombination protein Bet